MSENPLASELRCTQCGGELHPDEGQIFITCPYCNSTVYLDKSQVVFHWHLAPTMDEIKARGSLARWMAGNQTVKDLDKKSQVSDQSFAYFPLWYFKFRSDEGQDEIRQFPAAATSVTEIRRINVPAGDLQKFDDSLGPQSQRPTVPLETALGWLAERGISREQISEMAIVHIPLYSFKYTYQENLYTAIVEAATGEVFANIFPAKSESPYRLIGVLAAAIFLCLATFPIIGALLNGVEGLGIGFLICVGLGLLVAPLLFGFAAWVAAKI
jgi:DNA-directed RNA polymerase subunit RPC12/RpoP